MLNDILLNTFNELEQVKNLLENLKKTIQNKDLTSQIWYSNFENEIFDYYFFKIKSLANNYFFENLN